MLDLLTIDDTSKVPVSNSLAGGVLFLGDDYRMRVKKPDGTVQLATGDKGDKGDLGLKGDKGDLGLKGDKGDKGDLGGIPASVKAAGLNVPTVGNPAGLLIHYSAFPQILGKLVRVSGFVRYVSTATGQAILVIRSGGLEYVFLASNLTVNTQWHHFVAEMVTHDGLTGYARLLQGLGTNNTAVNMQASFVVPNNGVTDATVLDVSAKTRTPATTTVTVFMASILVI